MKVETDLYDKIWNYKLKDVPVTSTIKYPTGTLRIDEAFKLVNKGDKFLDVGCGTGGFAFLVREKFKEVYGVDVSERAVQSAKKLGIKAYTVNLNEEKFPFKDNFFDTVACLAVIEHVFEPEVLLSELSRVTKKGGTLVLDTPNIRYIKYMISTYVRGEFPKTSGDIEHSYDGGHLHYFTYKDIKNLLSAHGFKMTRHVPAHMPEAKRKFLYKMLRFFGPWFEKEFLSIEILVSARKIK